MPQPQHPPQQLLEEDEEEQEPQIGVQPSCDLWGEQAQSSVLHQPLLPGFDGPGVEDAPGPGASSPKAAMLCPQPRRIFAPPLPMVEGTAGMPGSTQDEACNELRELLGNGKDSRLLFDANQAPESRPLSSVSTSAGPTPSPEERVSTPLSPTPDIYDPTWIEGGVDSALVSRERPGIPAQVRKVFVGGIPQNMNQDDLFTIFSAFSGVKKAWLQRHRSTGGSVFSAPPRNHRGFGFVIFHDGNAVDKLLGPHASRFIMLADGRKLEVKRAVSSNDMMTAPTNPTGSPPQKPASPEPKWQGGRSPKPPGSPWPSETQWLGQLPPMPPPLPSLAAQSASLATTPPWPGSGNGSVITVMPPHTLPQPYPNVPGVYIAGTTSSPQPGIAQVVQGSGVAGVPHEGQPESMVGRMSIALAPGQSWVVDPASHNAVQLAIGQARVAGPTPPQQLTPQAMSAQWTHSSTASGAVPSQWAQIAAGSGAPPQWAHSATAGGAVCAVQWRSSATEMSASQHDLDTRCLPNDGATSSSGGGAAPVALPENLLMAPRPQHPPAAETYNNKELESALLQAMPDFYED